MLLSMQRPVLQVNLPGQAERGERDKTTRESLAAVLATSLPQSTQRSPCLLTASSIKNTFSSEQSGNTRRFAVKKDALLSPWKSTLPSLQGSVNAEEGQPPDLRQISSPHSLRASTHDRSSRRRGTQLRSRCPCTTGLSGTGPLFCY